MFAHASRMSWRWETNRLYETTTKSATSTTSPSTTQSASMTDLPVALGAAYPVGRYRSNTTLGTWSRKRWSVPRSGMSSLGRRRLL